MVKKIEVLEEDCRIYEVVKFLSYKWNIFLLIKFWEDRNHEFSFSELKREFKTITSKSLSLKLKNLEKNKVISKRILKTKGNKIETYYKLTREGKKLIPILKLIKFWGDSIYPCKVEKYCNRCQLLLSLIHI